MLKEVESDSEGRRVAWLLRSGLRGNRDVDDGVRALQTVASVRESIACDCGCTATRMAVEKATWVLRMEVAARCM
ncbi:hypothetical protein C1879_10445 [Paraeggerthella hongkongensis]|nr:hypothetical protein C1879_10445 [Paraeggerthella hongkongensis]